MNGKITVGKKDANKSAWMLTFADLLSLLLVFFVLIYSMTEIEGGQWNRVVESLKKAFAVSHSVGSTEGFNQLGVETDDFNLTADLNYLYSVLLNKTTESSLDSISSLHLWNNKLILSIESEILFNGDNVLSPSLEVDFLTVIQNLQSISNTIEVKAWVEFPFGLDDKNNPWIISLKRAMNVMDVFRSQGRTGDILASAGPLSLPKESEEKDEDDTLSKDYLYIIVYDKELVSSSSIIAKNEHPLIQKIQVDKEKETL